jgi:hypothetical protein
MSNNKDEQPKGQRRHRQQQKPQHQHQQERSSPSRLFTALASIDEADGAAAE